VSEPELSYYYSRASSLDNSRFDKKIRVALLSSFTINGLAETLRVKCAEKKVNCITYVSGYNQYAQDILDPESKLYKFSPDISFLILDTRSILKNLFYSPYSVSAVARRDYIDKRTEELLNLIKAYNRRLNSKFVITNFGIPTFSPYGIYETKTQYSFQEMVIDLNSKLNNALFNEPSIYIYDFNGFTARYGENNVFDWRHFVLGDMKVALNYIPYLAEDLMGYIKPLSGLSRKCIVLDLDNTLWGGIVGEDGFEGIELGPKPPGVAFVEFQRNLLSLYQRGIILAINSRNNPDDALKVIRDHPYMELREENFACLKINWNDKISNMKEIAAELNIGLDSIVYFDDDPINRELMSKALPEVLTVDLPKDPSLYTPALNNLNDLNVLKITEEDTKRGQMYVQQRKRTDFEKTVTNLDEFLSQLGIKIKIKKADQFTIPRIAQLILKTNQFNLTTRRYQEEDIRKFAQDKDVILGCAQIEDRFGDNGITAAFIVKKDNAQEWNIDTFLLSCRVMGRGVEDAIMAFILNEAKKEGVTKVKGQYIPTKKNKPCEDFYSSYGFKQEGQYWIYQPNVSVKIPTYLELLAE
jgi:FkbH-like protein